MGFDELANDRQPEPGAIGTRGHKGFEDPPALVLRDARAAIFDAEQQCAIAGLGGDVDFSPSGRMLQGIKDEIVQGASEVRRVELRFDLRRIDTKRDSQSMCMLFELTHAILQPLAYRQRFWMEVERLHDRHQALHQIIEALNLLQHGFQGEALAPWELRQRVLGLETYGGDRATDLV
jgi:hypothetical protein